MGKEILSPRQVAFLNIMEKSSPLSEHFCLTGGTALAAFYLHHRYSEDLDFFSENEVDAMAVTTFLKSHQAVLGFTSFEFQQSFNRNLFFLHYPDEVLKTEFTYFPFPALEQGLHEGALRVDSLRDIAVNKVFTVHQKPRARDFVDLYFIFQKTKWLFVDLLREARVKFDTHIDLVQMGAHVLKVRELKDMPRMKMVFSMEDCEKMFLDIAASLKNDIVA